MGDEQASDVAYLEAIVKGIVNHPAEVRISRSTDEMGVLLELGVNPEDMGLIIGRSGSTAKAIRTLVRIVGMRNNARVNLRILEPDGSRHERPAVASRPEKTRSVDDIVGDL